MIELMETPEGILLPVKGQPGAKRNGVVGVHAGMLKVAVTVAPEKGRATAAILDILADALKLKRSNIELVSGATSPQKLFRVTGISREELQEKLQFLWGD